MTGEDLTFEVVWLDNVAGEITECGREEIKRYDLSAALTWASHRLAHSKGKAAYARGFVVHMKRPAPEAKPGGPYPEPSRVTVTGEQMVTGLQPVVEHTFTLVARVAGGTLEEARTYLSGVIEVGDGEERLTNIDIHDEDLTSR